MLKVLHFVSVMDRGGQETFIMNIYRNLDRQKIQFDFLCSSNKKGDYDEEIRSLGGKIIYLDIERKGGKFTKYIYEMHNTVKFLSKIAKDYDIVHLHNYHAFSSYISVSACKKAGFKNIILHSHNSYAPHEKLHKIFRVILSRNKKITRFACSEEAGKWMHGKNKFKVIYNGIDVEKFRFDENNRRKIRTELNVSDDDYLVGMVGRFNYQKNHLFALDVFRKCVDKYPNSKLVLVGRGESEGEIKKKIKEMSLSDDVILLGVREDVNELMSGFDVLLMPSVFEGLGIVLVEAQYCKLPIVASDVLVDEVFISDGIITLSLNEGKDIWADNLMRVRTVDREDITVKDERFDINTVAYDLCERYYELTNKERRE